MKNARKGYANVQKKKPSFLAIMALVLAVLVSLRFGYDYLGQTYGETVSASPLIQTLQSSQFGPGTAVIYQLLGGPALMVDAFLWFCVVTRKKFCAAVIALWLFARSLVSNLFRKTDDMIKDGSANKSLLDTRGIYLILNDPSTGHERVVDFKDSNTGKCGSLRMKYSQEGITEIYDEDTLVATIDQNDGWIQVSQKNKPDNFKYVKMIGAEKGKRQTLYHPKKPGKTRCTCCGSEVDISREVWYQDRRNDRTVIVTFRFGNISAEVYGPESSRTKVKVTDYKLSNGYLSNVNVEYRTRDNAGNDTISRGFLFSRDRICPHCRKEEDTINFLIPKAGFYPSIFVVLLGSPETGKTFFMESVVHNLSVNLPNGWRVSATSFDSEVDGDTVDVFEASPVDTYKGTNIYVKDDSGKVRLQVSLMDTAGELNVQKSFNTDAAHKVLAQVASYADALILMYDPRFIKSKDLLAYQKNRKPIRGDVENLLTEIFDIALPVTIVMTGADRLRQIAEKSEGIHNRKGIPEVMPGSLLLRDRPLTEKNLLKHIALAGNFFESMTNVDTRNGKSPACFVISSGEELYETDKFGKQKKMLSFEHSMNVSYPIAYILNEFGKLSLAEED